MPKNYTRQRQGRDFSLLEEISRIKNAEMSVEADYSRIDGILGNNALRDDYAAKTLTEQLEYGKALAERNRDPRSAQAEWGESAAPVDGDEPPPERSAPGRAR
jgi:hypothetical protein